VNHLPATDISSISETASLIALGLGLVVIPLLLRKKFSKRHAGIDVEKLSVAKKEMH